MFLKNDKLIGVSNGETGIINSITDKGIMNVAVGRNRININVNHYNYIDHSYAITDFKSQGGSYNRVFFSAVADRVNLNSFYVAATRAKEDFYLLTDNVDEFIKDASKAQEKKSTLDHTWGKDNYEAKRLIEDAKKYEESGKLLSNHEKDILNKNITELLNKDKNNELKDDGHKTNHDMHKDPYIVVNESHATKSNVLNVSDKTPKDISTNIEKGAHETFNNNSKPIENKNINIERQLDSIPVNQAGVSSHPGIEIEM